MRILLSSNHRYPAFTEVSAGFAPMDYPSGSGNYVHDLLARGLAEAGHRVYYLLRKGWSGEMPPGVAPVSEPVIDVDVYHSSMIPGVNEDVAQLMQDNHRAWVTTCHLDRSRIGPAASPNWIFVSRSLALAHGSDRYVLNGIDPDQCIFSSCKQDYLLFLCAMDRAMEKGLDTALRLAHLHRVRLVVAGSARSAKTIEDVSRICAQYEAEYLGDVRGRRKAELLAYARALLFPSRMNEGCPLAILEALASGTPVLSTRVGGCPEILTPDTGFLCDSLSDFSAALDQVHHIRPADCRQTVIERFHYLRMTADYLRQYEMQMAAAGVSR
jgi:glycosyltransferase involved in cell wall biosynthesis